MGIQEAEQLQQEIDEQMRLRNLVWPRLVLDHDADVIDLTSNVDVRVYLEGAPRYRDFCILSYKRLENILHDERLGRSGPEEDRYYCVGMPLCIVNKISGRSVVAAILDYLKQEPHRIQ